MEFTTKTHCPQCGLMEWGYPRNDTGKYCECLLNYTLKGGKQ